MKKVEEEIDKTVAGLYGITNEKVKKVKEVKKILEVLKGRNIER